ncbi:MAG: PIN domain-containing protein [Gammaproteobacteria bacterium]|nr:PIN domain-containing protein [Gammaproteobacteria bacterium]
MIYLLDTDICIYIIKHRPVAVRERLAQLAPGSAGISSVTLGELAYGAANSDSVAANFARIEAITEAVDVLQFGADAALRYGALRAVLKRQGRSIGPLDMLIAGHALALDLTLVSNNTREFSRIEGLRIENWIDAHPQ